MDRSGSRDNWLSVWLDSRHCTLYCTVSLAGVSFLPRVDERWALPAGGLSYLGFMFVGGRGRLRRVGELPGLGEGLTDPGGQQPRFITSAFPYVDRERE